MATALAQEIAPGVYVTDGKRLAEVLGVDAEGLFHLEDCAKNYGEDAPTLAVPREVLVAEWKVVRGGDSQPT
jgi:hypothetical protein